MLLYSCPTPCLNKIFKDICLFYNLENILFILLKFSPKNWCLPPGVFNGQAVLSEGHFLPEGERYLQTGILALLGMNQWEIVLSNSCLPQPTTTKPLASSPRPRSYCSRVKGKALTRHRTFPVSKWEKSFPSCFYHCCLSVPSTRKRISPQSQDGWAEEGPLPECPSFPPPTGQIQHGKLRLGTVHSGFLFPINGWRWVSRPSAYLDSCLPDINAILMPLKYESMPKITFCFTKDYLEEIKHFQFFQCFETLVYLLCWCAFL